MDCVFGLTGKDFTLIVCDTQYTFSVLNMRHTVDKVLEVDNHHAIGLTGEMGDTIHFGEFIKANLQLYQYRNKRVLDTRSVANFTRNELASALRRGPYMCNMLIGGFDEEKGPQLYFLDYLAMLHRVNTSGHGYGALMVRSILDREWRADLTKHEAMDIARRCIGEIKTRFVAAPACFLAKCIDSDGITTEETFIGADVDASS